MKLNSKVTWGLAWAGLAVVLAVPSADYLTGQFGLKGNSAAVITSTTDPVTTGATAAPQKTAAVTTTVTKTGVKITPAGAPLPGAPTLDPVDKFTSSGKQLPDYISDGDSTQTATTKTAPGATSPVLAAPSEEPTQVANLDSSATVLPPTPFPRRPPDIVRPVLPKAATPTQPTVIVDEGALPVDQGGMPDALTVGPDAGPLPPAGIQDDWRAARDRRLTQYLEQNGLIDEASADGRSSASVTVVQRPSSDYDPNGFYLSDGPNNSKAERRRRILRMLEEGGDVSWF